MSGADEGLKGRASAKVAIVAGSMDEGIAPARAAPLSPITAAMLPAVIASIPCTAAAAPCLSG